MKVKRRTIKAMQEFKLQLEIDDRVVTLRGLPDGAEYTRIIPAHLSEKEFIEEFISSIETRFKVRRLYAEN